jgi:hypothetical protein
MSSRLQLQAELCDVLGTNNVYYQPPESIKMRYPAIKYSLSKVNMIFASNSVYANKRAYQVILIDDNPDTDMVDDILALPYCQFDRSYVSDNLNHFVFTLYF